MAFRCRCIFAAFLLTAALALAGPSADHFQFAIIGDRTGEAVPGVYEQVWRNVRAAHPAFAISVGDTIEGENDATADAEWRSMRRLWTLPFFLAPGNHDVWSDSSARAYTRATGRPLSYSFDWQNAHFTVLDNSRTEELSQDQLDFLERDLAAHRDKSPKFVVFHRSYWIIWLKLGNPNFPLNRIAHKYGVTAVISGHVHQYDRMEQGGVTYLMVCSSGGHLRTADGGEDPSHGWFFGYIMATVDGPRVEFTLRPLHAVP